MGEETVVQRRACDREIEQVRVVGKPVGPAGGGVGAEPDQEFGIEPGAFEHEYEIGTVATKRGGEAMLERAAEQRVEPAGALFADRGIAAERGERGQQRAAGVMVSLIELRDEEHPRACMRCRHPPKVIRCYLDRR